MLRSLQACRAVAALLVVLFHASVGIFNLPKYFGCKPFGPVFDFGFVGVDFFFVLSGFIMVYVHAADFGQPRALGAYFWKRVSFSWRLSPMSGTLANWRRSSFSVERSRRFSPRGASGPIISFSSTSSAARALKSIPVTVQPRCRIRAA